MVGRLPGVSSCSWYGRSRKFSPSLSRGTSQSFVLVLAIPRGCCVPFGHKSFRTCQFDEGLGYRERGGWIRRVGEGIVGVAWRSLHSVQVSIFKKTEGLELGAVDKLLVGIFVGCDGEEGGEMTHLTHPRPSYLLLRCYPIAINHDKLITNRIIINSSVLILVYYIED
jgi:hypothetical protein